MVPRPRLIAIKPRYRRPQHKWSQEERLLLCCARRFFDLMYRDIAKIFNHIYATNIRAEGFPNGLPAKTINTQWEDMRRRDHKDWRAVHSDVSFNQGPSLFHHLMEKIRHACRVLHIGLVARARDLVQTPQGRPILPQSRTTQQSPGTTRQYMTLGAPANNTVLHSPVIDQETLIDPGRPETSTQPSQTSRIPPTISRIRSFKMNGRSEEPIRPSQVPHVLWRFSNDQSMGINHRSGYIANAFINDIGDIPTPNERAEEFPTWLEIHVRPRRIPSPFISTSTDPLVAVHRALSRDQNAFVSIIDSTQIKSQNIFYMKDLMKQYDIYTPGYRGAREYVVWGSICRSAIVTSIRADEFIQIANTHPDIRAALQLDVISASKNCKSQLHNRLAERTFESDFIVGRTIGKFLRIIRLQSDYLGDVAVSLNNSWSFTLSDDTAEFLLGVNQGFQITMAPSTPVHVPQITFHSQETIIQSQDESTSENITQQVGQHADMEDYVIVNHPQQEDIADAQATEIRQSIERLSFQEDAEAFSDYQTGSVVRSSPAIETTTATRIISFFNPDSESRVGMPETQRLTTPGVVESIEDVLPASDQGDTGEDVDVKVEAVMQLPSLSQMPSPQPDTRSQEPAVFQPSTNPTRNHTRSYSESSDSTIGAQTPATNHRFLKEHSHGNHVLNYDWPTFWDQLHNVAHQ
ncbi:hypothetical protein EYB26_007932 [Talaromyces marneffei]|uniref:uncharacterized protein n=1 Tax=Talaromyces marneffei TaxID=37727 RepID=UPI0012A86E0D|nr:uncharacterized protein EYB26_007932 [Talaromyces marneffei]QGA20230.1 hypothetical protein EYB26_007932 [Talaromyces marneffei]